MLIANAFSLGFLVNLQLGWPLAPLFSNQACFILPTHANYTRCQQQRWHKQILATCTADLIHCMDTGSRCITYVVYLLCPWIYLPILFIMSNQDSLLMSIFMTKMHYYVMIIHLTMHIQHSIDNQSLVNFVLFVVSNLKTIVKCVFEQSINQPTVVSLFATFHSFL